MLACWVVVEVVLLVLGVGAGEWAATRDTGGPPVGTDSKHY